MREFTARFATDEEIREWDSHVTANPSGGNLLQGRAFADVKKDHGWQPRYVVYEPSDGSRPSHNLVLEKRVPALGKLWYMIKGPDVETLTDIPGIVAANEELVTRHAKDVFAIKYEPEIVASDRADALLARAGLVRAFEIQPNDSTAVLDTTPDEKDLLKSLHSRGRNAVRRATREGCEVHRVEPTEENMRAMYGLMNTVGQGHADVTLRSYEYYRAFWTNFAERGQGRMYFGYEDGEASVGAYVIAYGSKGTYKDGGSKPRRKQYGDSHLLQWRAVTDLKNDFGIEQYDLCGTPPSDQLKNKDHPYYGLGLFKTSFTKTVVDYVGVWDQPFSRVKYAVWTRIAEKIQRRLWVRRTGQPFY